jgi:hypothetical protein
MRKRLTPLLILAFLTASCLVVSRPAFSSAATKDSGDSYTSAPPLIYILENESYGVSIDYFQHTNHPIIYSDTGNVTLWVKIRMPYQVYNAKLQGTVMWVGGHLTSVSYEASWQNNETVELYDSTSNNGQGQFEFYLTNIPYGIHHLEVNASCVVFILDDYSGSTHPFYDSAEKSLDVTVAPTPTPTPSSPPSTGILSGENLVLFASLAVAAVLIAVVAVAVFRRRKKQTLPASPT